MKALLEKWYLDLTTPEATGFFYIMRVSLGPLRFGVTGINTFRGRKTHQSFRVSRIRHSGLHVLDLGHARLSLRHREAELRIRHGRTQVRGHWQAPAPGPPRPRRPLYQNACGRCDWKVWLPKADVRLSFASRGEAEKVERGTGYVDFVRSSFPAWDVPFRRLYWGRMHSRDSWGVFLALKTSDSWVSCYLDPRTVDTEVEVRLTRDSSGAAQHMDWTLGREGDTAPFRGSITQVLESQAVLNRGRLMNLLPKRILGKLSSAARDEKYAVTSVARSQEFWGIMEEVRWNEN
jgi:hypothetical protein